MDELDIHTTVCFICFKSFEAGAGDYIEGVGEVCPICVSNRLAQIREANNDRV